MSTSPVDLSDFKADAMDLSDFTPDAPAKTYASPPGTPIVQKPQAPAMNKVNLITGGRAVEIADNPVVQHVGDVVSQMAKPLYNVSTPGVAMSLLRQKFPNASLPLPEGGPVNQIPSTAMQTLGGAMLGGSEEEPITGQPRVTPRPPSPAPIAANSGPSAASILARHIPIVGKALRTIDDVQALLGKDAPQNAANIAGAKAPIPETNGIQWGSGGQGPLDLRGKMIPQATQTAQDVPLTGAKAPASQGADPYSMPRTPQMEQAQSTTIAQHGYHADSQTMVVQFKNGKVYEYRGVPQKVYNQYQQSESQGSFFANNIKGRYQTSLRGTVKPSPGQQISSALGSR